MNRLVWKLYWVGVLAALQPPFILFAQESPAVPSAVVASNSSRALQPPPTPPLGKCPVELFRQLLAMAPEQRLQAVAARPEPSQKLLLAKIQEYESLSPQARELRLKATELRWYLLPLLSASATNRASQLAVIPPETRKLVADRLKAWDRLSPAERQRLLNPAADYLAKEAVRTLMPPPLPPLPPDRKLLLEAGVQQWRELSERQRDALTNRFVTFFEFTPQEKAKILSVLPETERQQIQATLDKFQNLGPMERAVCIRNFQRFAGLSVVERDQFLKNAEHWKLMSPAERATWTDLVNKFETVPPLPPGFNSPHLPPMPGGTATEPSNTEGVLGSSR